MVTDPFIGRLVDSRYEIVDRVARGGMATVYLARDRRLDRRVALKVMHAHLADSPDFVARFRREARAAARLSNPGVVAVYDQGTVDGLAYLVMELVEGSNLRVLLASGPVSVKEALELTAQVLHPLGAAHRAGLIHRDVKPENVLLPADGSVAKVADFGLARAITEATQTTTGNILGTVAYLAPELITKGVATPRADVFSVGVILYELLTGVQPFTADSPIQVAYRTVHEDVPAPSLLVPGLAPGVDELAAAMTRRESSSRLADADAALAAVREVLDSLSEEELAVRRGEDGTDHSDAGTRTVSLPIGSIGGDATRALAREAAVTQSQETAPVAGARRTRRRAVLGAGVLVLLAGGVTGAWYFGIGPGRRVTVPDIAGLSEEQARDTLVGAELEWGSPGRDYSDTVPAGSVISATPAPGSSVRVGTAITAVISRGVEQKKVPDVVGKPQAEAEKAVEEAGLSVGAVTEDFSDDVAAGAIISSSPASGEMVNHSSAVAMVVSKGRRPATVPDVTGKSLEEATAAIQEAGLTLSGSTEAFSDDVAAGLIISSDPAAEAEGYFYGDSVSVVVSKGPEMVTVPEVVSKSEADAKAALEAAGLVVSVNRILGGFFGTARSTDPAAGTSVRKGSTVTLYVV
ncbi:serine/threonine-protein kinase PrkC [Actinomyces urogenitalis DSM 15434]|uniref:non-specific serine/threonine protein kinase n=3 Tax=Actinomyces urogenitalis TaxID=103621 RepID=C0W355_9ACTO|nr:Stk1 family PASTA domain-containing Ser/Thr kinase [Actinomyces urogenitalis]EEH66867.1 serine/threonine-protein kinase PrkC [Actinomyces urogenitalis DSM 15434]MDK8835960.1 Stk1 family PASTA domain-containing Ser/Thr kinase [Actinomyces urogenitalis]PKY99597.1 serine/threonine-protein kinase [Actinomyces urogenitalis]